MRAEFVKRSIFVSALILFLSLLSFHSSWLSIEGTTSAQDPNATLPSSKKTPTQKNATPRKRPNSGNSSTGEIAFWDSIKNSTDPEDFKSYIDKYPNGQFVAMARNNLRRLEGANKTEDKVTTNKNSAAGNPETTKPAAKPGAVVKNQIGIEFILLAPGSFMMGSTNGNPDERPVHQVTINYSFYMGKYEVTQAQWLAVMGNNPSAFLDCANCPVEQVSWYDAQSFINKLNRSNDGFRYRLPTEAEWEYACRAGTTEDYSGNLSEMAWYSENSGSRTHAVGGKQPNAWGLADMQGNVWEWCQDWYHETYYGAPTDGSAWLSGGEQKNRVLRGGSWVSEATKVGVSISLAPGTSKTSSDLRSASRSYGYPPNNRSYIFGIRCVALPRTQ